MANYTSNSRFSRFLSGSKNQGTAPTASRTLSGTGGLFGMISGVKQRGQETRDRMSSTNSSLAAERYNALKPTGTLPQAGPRTQTTKATKEQQMAAIAGPSQTPVDSTVSMAGGSTPNRQQEGISQGLTGADLQRYVETGQAPTTSAIQTPTTTTTAVQTQPQSPTAAPTLQMASTQSQAPQSQLSALQQAYQQSLVPTADEQALQSELTNLQESGRLGILGQEGQGRGIPLALVRGRQALIGEQANIQQQTLIDRLSQLQSQRAAQQQAVQSQLEFAQQQEEAARAERQFQQQFGLQQAQAYAPFEFGGNLVRLNPQTGGLDIVAEGPTTAVEPVTLSAGQSLVNPQTGQVLYTAPAKELSATEQQLEAIKLQQAQLELQKLGFDVQDAISGGGTSQFGQQLATQTTETVDEALALFKTVDGLGALGRVAASKIPGTDSYNFARVLETIKANVGFNTLQSMRDASKTGGALGQVSERELDFLNSVLGSLDIGQSNDQLVSNLEKIKESVNRWNTAVQESGGTGGVQDDPLGLFSSAPSTAVNGSDISGVVSGFKGNVVGSIQPSTTLATVSIGNKNVQVNQSIAQRLQAADAEYFAATGQHIPVNQSFRDQATQQRLYQELSAKGAQVAPAGYSFHELGMAVDVGDAWESVRPYLQKYGFRNDLPNDRGHFSIGEFA